MIARVSHAPRLRGVISVPGDKSMSHRAAIFNAIAEGSAEVRGFLQGDDCLSTVDCLRALGADLHLDAATGTLTVRGAGLHGLREPERVLDAGNSGTTMRLLAGLLAGQPFYSVLTGDDSLRTRPMARVLDPLRRMGASCWARAGDLAPISLQGGGLHGITYPTPVASAQVKSSLLLAGLFANSATVIEEPAASRDHTERLLRAMGADIRIEALSAHPEASPEPGRRVEGRAGKGPTVTLTPPDRLEAVDLRIPGDISAAAFWIVLAAAHPDAEITLPAVGVNPTRTGVIDALRAMGARIEVTEERTWGGEPVADITVRSSDLTGIEIGGRLVLSAMDEVPVLAVAAAVARGRTVVRDAAELRVKESDRIAEVVRSLRRFGVEVEETPDGMVIDGGRPLTGAGVDSGGDHRLAMALAVAGLIARGDTAIARSEAVDISYPGFWRHLASLTERVRSP